MPLALVASVSAIIGSVVTGWFTYIAAVNQRETEQYKRRLRRADKNIAAFHRLEERYTQALQSENKSKCARAWTLELIEHAVHINRCVFEEPVSSSKFWRLQPGSWRIRVVSAIHGDYKDISGVNKIPVKVTNKSKLNKEASI
jgi:hypothetical protein